MSYIPRAWEDENGNFIVWGTHDKEISARELVMELISNGYDHHFSTEEFRAAFIEHAEPHWTTNLPQDEHWTAPVTRERYPGSQPVLIWAP